MGGNLRLPALSEHFLSKRWADWLTNCGLQETTEGIRGEECPLCPVRRWDASASLALLTSIPLLYKPRRSSACRWGSDVQVASVTIFLSILVNQGPN